MDERLIQAEAIVFDVGNVLLTFEADKVCSLLPSEHREALKQAMFGPDWHWAAFDLGAEPDEAIAQSMADQAGVPDGRDMILYALYHFPETMNPLPLYHLIPELKKMGKKLYGLTNYNGPAFAYTQERFENLQLMDGVVVSHREKLVKPDAAIFQLLRQRYHLIPEHTLFIDDVENNTAAAAREGFRVWHYAGEDRL